MVNDISVFCRALELSIMAYEGQDPLEQWTKYINWLEENYPKGGKEGDLLTVLEQVFQVFSPFASNCPPLPISPLYLVS